MAAAGRPRRFPVFTLLACVGAALLLIVAAWLNQGRRGPLQQARYAAIFQVEPNTRSDGTPWRVGLCQGGPWIDYDDQLRATLKGLKRLGWISELPPDGLDTLAQWDWMSRQSSPYVGFDAAHVWDCAWDEDERAGWAEGVRAELRADRVDVVLAFGTWAGQALAVDSHSTPTMVLSTTDPIRAGIVESATDSGRDHVHARCDPERYLRQARLFHTLVGFERLGVISDGTPEGHIWNNVPDLEQVGAQLGFEVVVEVVPHAGHLPDKLPAAIEPLLAARVPTYAQAGTDAVARGVLMGIESRDLDDMGLFFAQALTSILNGVRPRDIPLVFEDPKGLVINVAVAERIGFVFPPAVQRHAEAVMTRIEADQQR
jgi:hypothetical protein